MEIVINDLAKAFLKVFELEYDVTANTIKNGGGTVLSYSGIVKEEDGGWIQAGAELPNESSNVYYKFGDWPTCILINNAQIVAYINEITYSFMSNTIPFHITISVWVDNTEFVDLYIEQDEPIDIDKYLTFWPTASWYVGVPQKVFISLEKLLKLDNPESIEEFNAFLSDISAAFDNLDIENVDINNIFENLSEFYKLVFSKALQTVPRYESEIQQQIKAAETRAHECYDNAISIAKQKLASELEGLNDLSNAVKSYNGGAANPASYSMLPNPKDS